MSYFNNQKEISLKFPSWKEVVIEYSKKELGSDGKLEYNIIIEYINKMY